MSVAANSILRFRKDVWDPPRLISVCRNPVWEFCLALYELFQNLMITWKVQTGSGGSEE